MKTLMDTNTNGVPQKKIIRYLGVHLDFTVSHDERVKLQIDKAQRAFTVNKRMFYAKNFDNRVELLCYKLLICLILIFCCPIWFNISASMEKGLVRA